MIKADMVGLGVSLTFGKGSSYFMWNRNVRGVLALLLLCLFIPAVSAFAAQPTGYYVKASDLIPVYGDTVMVQSSSSSRKSSSCPYRRPNKPLSYDQYHYPAIKRGDEGVKWLQWQLKAKGYYHGNIDGYYGEGTERAVREYQEDHGLVADGRAYTQTFDSLER